VETLLDDRAERPGVKFNDADLTGIPFRVVVGGRELAGDKPRVEIKRRAEKEGRLAELSLAAEDLSSQLLAEMARLNG
jgi:prolyl-tRNA synthetase